MCAPKWACTPRAIARQFGSLKSRDTSRILPIVNVDSGITLERQAKLFGGSFVQTVEPRLFYNYTPSKSQKRSAQF